MQEYNVDPSDTSLRGLPLYYGDFDKELSTGSTNGTTIILAPVPDQAYSVELHYLHKPNSLVTDTTGTWISQNARNGLFYGCLVEAYTFMKGEPDLIQLYETRFNLEMARLKNRAEGRGTRDAGTDLGRKADTRLATPSRTPRTQASFIPSERPCCCISRGERRCEPNSVDGNLDGPRHRPEHPAVRFTCSFSAFWCKT